MGIKRSIYPLVSLLLANLLLSCATIEHYKIVDQELDVNLRTYPGGTIIKITKQKDLPNAFGKADLWGGKVDEGFIELKYFGEVDENKFALGLKEVSIVSNETSMSRYGGSVSTVNITTNKDHLGNYYTTGVVTSIKSPESRTYVLPPDYYDFVWDLSKGNIFSIEGYSIQFIHFDQQQLMFQISRENEK